jgi:hypothetical protein
MKRPWPQILGIAIGFISAMLIYQVVRRLDFNQKTNADLIEIGQIIAIEGLVERRLPGAVATETVPAPGPFYHQDLLITQRDSSLTLRFKNAETVLKLNEAARFVAEQDPTNANAVRATILDGGVQLIQAGKPELIKFYRDGAEVALGDLGKTQVPSIQAPPPELIGPPPPASTGPQLIITATKPVETATPSVSKTDDAQAVTSDVLTNDDILKQMRRQSGLFQRCYLGHIHREQKKSADASTPLSPQRGGTITVSFTIDSNGKMTDVRQLKTDFADRTLNSCVLEVVERTVFRGFRGQPVPVLEFPITLQ